MKEANIEILDLIEKNVYELFELEKVKYKSLLAFLKESKTVARYFKESNLSTDNAWLEYQMINVHDYDNEIFSKATFKNKARSGKRLVWKVISDDTLAFQSKEAFYLKKIAQMID